MDKIIEILTHKWYIDCLVYNIPVSPSDIRDVMEDLLKTKREAEEEGKMKKYTLKDYKKFCDEALICPPFEDDEQIEYWFETHKIHIIANDCVMELEYDADAINEIEFGLKEIYEALYGSGEPTTGNTVAKKDCEVAMTQTEFKEKLTTAFKTYMFMKDRDRHTVNELLYVLEHDSRFGRGNFNISIRDLGGYWISIPCLDVLVPTQTRGMWFEDAEVEFEVEEVGEERYNCITIYEREEA